VIGAADSAPASILDRSRSTKGRIVAAQAACALSAGTREHRGDELTDLMPKLNQLPVELIELIVRGVQRDIERSHPRSSIARARAWTNPRLPWHARGRKETASRRLQSLRVSDCTGRSCSIN
jgi:hypothetical protein